MEKFKLGTGFDRIVLQIVGHVLLVEEVLNAEARPRALL